MSRAFITGGVGFIGSHLTERLLKEGWNVSVFDNFDPFYDPAVKRGHLERIRKQARADQFTFHEGDLREKKQVIAALRAHQPDIIIHLAALAGVRPSIERPSDYHDVNVGGTLNLLEAATNLSIPNFIFGSSSSVYGGNKKVPYSVDDMTHRPISPYAATKKAGELYTHTFHDLHNLNTIALRIFTAFGPRQRPDLAIHKFTKLILQGKPIPFFGDGTTTRDYTYVEDIVDGIMKSAKWLANQSKPQFEIVNLGNSSPTSLNELVKTIEACVGKKAILDQKPMQPGDMITTYADIEKTKKLLGYSPKTSLAVGIENFVAWYRDLNP